jgi:hypothetical protein
MQLEGVPWRLGEDRSDFSPDFLSNSHAICQLCEKRKGFFLTIYSLLEIYFTSSSDSFESENLRLNKIFSRKNLVILQGIF